MKFGAHFRNTLYTVAYYLSNENAFTTIEFVLDTRPQRDMMTLVFLSERKVSCTLSKSKGVWFVLYRLQRCLQ